MTYIVAFNRDRDSYQVPLALAERDLLGSFVTDYYHDANSLVGRVMAERLGHRAISGLSPSLTRNTWEAVAYQASQRVLDDWMDRCDRAIARHARREMEKSDSDLFLYSSFAAESFGARSAVYRRKHLFLFHPHPSLISNILNADFDRFGIGRESLLVETGMTKRLDILDEEISLSDHIVCASPLSASSVAFSGLSKAPISVVPYGTIGCAGSEPLALPPDPVRFLFVGQGIQRKGLHHLLMVWRKLRPKNAVLDLVCATAQDGIVDDLPEGVTLHHKQTTKELEALYRCTHCFVLPALVEGFGLVLLEALAAGCHVIYSTATGLASYDVPHYAGTQIEPGDLDGLGAALEAAIDMVTRGQHVPDQIVEYALSIDSALFRQGVRDALALHGTR
jgi:glycosyltransferase involved in cell wall biosynthesis